MAVHRQDLHCPVPLFFVQYSMALGFAGVNFEPSVHACSGCCRSLSKRVPSCKRSKLLRVQRGTVR